MLDLYLTALEHSISKLRLLQAAIAVTEEANEMGTVDELRDADLALVVAMDSMQEAANNIAAAISWKLKP